MEKENKLFMNLQNNCILKYTAKSSHLYNEDINIKYKPIKNITIRNEKMKIDNSISLIHR